MKVITVYLRFALEESVVGTGDVMSEDIERSY